jgi:hypothetical protein
VEIFSASGMRFSRPLQRLTNFSFPKMLGEDSHGLAALRPQEQDYKARQWILRETKRV